MSSSLSTLKSILEAKSIALVGTPGPDGQERLTAKPLQYLIKYGYKGAIYPVNPRYDSVLGLTSHPSISSLPEAPEVALLLVRAELVRPTIEECIQKGVQGVIVVGGGYGERDEEGAKAEAELKELVRASGIRLIGPNCNGVINVRTGMTLGFQPFLDSGRLKSGPVGVVSQSGSFISAIMTRLSDRGLGFSFAVSCGNETDVGVADYLEALLDDAETRVIVLFLEAAREPGRFLALARRAREQGVPIVALKVGATEEAAQSSASHTGAVVGSFDAYLAMFAATGIIAVHSIEEMTEVTSILVHSPALHGPRIGLISNSGGVNAILADAIVAEGLQLTQLSPVAQDRITEILPFTTPINPVDLTGVAVDRPELLGSVIGALAEDDYDAIVFALALIPSVPALVWAEHCIAHHRSSATPLIIYAPSGNLPEGVEETLMAAGIPTYRDAATLLRGLREVVRFNQAQAPLRNDDGVQPSPRDRAALQGAFPAALEEFGIRYIRSAVIDPDQAVEAAVGLEEPLAVKLSTPLIAHKARIGGVLLNVGVSEVAAAVEAVSDAARNHLPEDAHFQIELQEMAPVGIEMMLGLKQDLFGPLVVVGAGGIHTEQIRDHATALCPVTPEVARGLVLGLRIGRLLSASVSAEAFESFVSLIVSVSNFGLAHEGVVRDLDLNPVILSTSSDAVCVVDHYVVWSD